MAILNSWGRHLGKALFDEGLVPKRCRNIELVMPGNGVITLRYEVFMEEEDLERWARALTVAVAAAAEEQAAFQQRRVQEPSE